MRQKGVPRKYIEELLEVVRKSAKNKRFLDEFFKDLLTPGEYEALALRWQIVQMLSEGLTQREIVDKLKIGIATVTRGARELQDVNGAFMKLLNGQSKKLWRSLHST